MKKFNELNRGDIVYKGYIHDNKLIVDSVYLVFVSRDENYIVLEAYNECIYIPIDSDNSSSFVNRDTTISTSVKWLVEFFNNKNIEL